MTMHTTFIGFYEHELPTEKEFLYHSFNDNDSETNNVFDHWDKINGDNKFMSCIVVKKVTS